MNDSCRALLVTGGRSCDPLGKVHCSRPLRTLNPWRERKPNTERENWFCASKNLSFLAVKMMKKIRCGERKRLKEIETDDKTCPVVQSPLLVKLWSLYVRLYAALLQLLLCEFIQVRSELCRWNVELSLLSPFPFYSRERGASFTQQHSYSTLLLSGRQSQQQWSESGQGSRRRRREEGEGKGRGALLLPPCTPTPKAPHHPSKDLANKTQDPLPPLHRVQLAKVVPGITSYLTLNFTF